MGNLSAYAVDRPPCAPVDAAATLRSTIRGALTTLRTWHRRASTRRHMLALDDHLLADIGMSRVDATREATKLFWQV